MTENNGETIKEEKYAFIPRQNTQPLTLGASLKVGQYNPGRREESITIPNR